MIEENDLVEILTGIMCEVGSLEQQKTCNQLRLALTAYSPLLSKDEQKIQIEDDIASALYHARHWMTDEIKVKVIIAYFDFYYDSLYEMSRDEMHDLINTLPGGNFFYTHGGSYGRLIDEYLYFRLDNIPMAYQYRWDAIAAQPHFAVRVMAQQVNAFGFEAVAPFPATQFVFYFEDETDECLARIKYPTGVL